MLKTALEYRGLGYSIIPVRQDKRPCIKWEQYQNAQASEDEIKKWWSKWPDANIGVVTGKISGINVIDIDTQDGLEALKEYIDREFKTPMCTTPGGGWHLWFKYREGLVNRSRTLTGCDIRTDGGYVVAPPSMNGNGKKYKWIKGREIANVDLNDIPDFLFSILLDAQNVGTDFAIKKDRIPYKDNLVSSSSSRTSTKISGDHIDHIDHKRLQMFADGRRDDDLFHTANILVKGGMPESEIYQILENLIKSWGEEPNRKWIETKIISALKRSDTISRNIAAEVKEWVLTTTGHFLTTDNHKDLNLTTRDHKKAANMALLRLVDEGILEKYGEKRGCYRRIEQDEEPMLFIEEDIYEYPLKLPFGLNDLCALYPKNIFMVAGSKGAGKTALLFNIAIANQERGKEVIYLNSEMGNKEWTIRLKKHGFTKADEIKIKGVHCKGSYHDKIDGSDKIFIVDFLEIHDNFYQIGKAIREIHEKLEEGICIIAIQKKRGELFGRGAEFSMEKARLYLSLDFLETELCSRLTIVDAKSNKTPKPISGLWKMVKIIDGTYMEAMDKEWRR